MSKGHELSVIYECGLRGEGCIFIIFVAVVIVCEKPEISSCEGGPEKRMCYWMHAQEDSKDGCPRETGNVRRRKKVVEYSNGVVEEDSKRATHALRMNKGRKRNSRDTPS